MSRNRRGRWLTAFLVLVVSLVGVAPAGTAVAAVPDDDSPSQGPWEYFVSVSPGEVDMSGGTVTVSMYVIADSGVVDHAPDVWFEQGGATTPVATAMLLSGDRVDGTWTAQAVVPAGASGTWDLVIADTTTTGGEVATPHTFTGLLRVGYPDPPGRVDAAATGVGTHVLLSWPAAHDGGEPITAYRVIDSYGQVVAVTSGDTRQVDVDLADSLAGRSPVYSVESENAVGRSTPSSSSPRVAAPATVPEAPSGLVGRFMNGGVVLSWQPSPHAFTSAVTSSVVTIEPGGETCTVAGLSCTVSGLTDGTVYTARVRSVNGIGASAPSAPLVLGPPPAVTDVSVDIIRTSAYVSWAPDPNTADPATYTVTSDDPGVGCRTSATSCRIDGLDPGRTYGFAVRAPHSHGPGAATAPVAATAVDTPSAPGGSAASHSDSVLTLRWSAPEDHGDPIEAYIVTGKSARGGWTELLPASARSARFTDLPWDVPLAFAVQAQNAIGAGPATRFDTVTMPNLLRLPSAPARPRLAVERSRRIAVSWHPAAIADGTAVDHYEIVVSRDDRIVQRITTDGAERVHRTKPLAAGRYVVRIRAHNRGGWSTASRLAALVVRR